MSGRKRNLKPSVFHGSMSVSGLPDPTAKLHLFFALHQTEILKNDGCKFRPRHQ